jgi:hypothetical protein
LCPPGKKVLNLEDAVDLHTTDIVLVMLDNSELIRANLVGANEIIDTVKFLRI